MNYITLLFAVINTAIVIVYAFDSLTHRKSRGLYPLIASFVVALAVIMLLHEAVSVTALFFFLSFALLFSILPFYYIRETRKLFLFLIIILAEFLYTTYLYGSLIYLYPFMQMFAIGTAFGAYYRSGFEVFKVHQAKPSKMVETKRDVVHIILGVIILLVFLFLPFYRAVYVVAMLVLLGYIYNSMLGKRSSGRLYSVLKSLERPEALYGLGALYLGIGMGLLLGFIHNLHFIIIGLAALFFADPIATIVGINLGNVKLFYNKNKSVIGTLAFFVVVSIIGFPFIGYYSLLFGVGLALVESIRFPVDDNITIPVVMILLYIIFLTSLGQLPF